jgi:hypothetical protein
VTIKDSQENYNSFVVHSNRTATVTGRSIVLSIHLTENTHIEDLTSVAFLLHVGPTFNHINRVLKRQNINMVCFGPSSMTLASKCLALTAPPANVVRSTLVKLEV